MATPEPGIKKAGRGSIFTWTATVLACAYIVWTGTMLYISTPKFIDMYSSMGVELPLPTRIVFAVYRFAYPLLFLGVTALLIAKQFYVREKWISLGTTLGAALVVEIISRGTIWALYRPMFAMAEKLNK
jgi:type II secretory pathway component PulF